MQWNPRESSIPRTVGVGLLFLVALTACTHFKGSPSPVADAPVKAPGTSASPSTTAPPTVIPPTVIPPEVSSGAGPPIAESAAPPAAGPPAAASSAPATAKPSHPKTAGNANLRTARSASPRPLPAEPGGTTAAGETAPAQPVARPPAPPALDLAGLEQRLKDTHAIGLFTKLSLKNQVDDLLAAFSAFHAGQPEPPLADLRQRYDLLLLKVLTLLQDGDPPLASAISASREAIWSLLADRDKFKKIQMG
jgi:hypothetical protein